jgi:hypothetical protein
VHARSEVSGITGIGPARARWLEQTFGVRTLRDLAALSPDDIEAKLKAEGRPAVSRTAIESWVAEAQARVRATESPQWKPVASFVVEFQSRPGEEAERRWQTAVHYLEEDRNETWPGIDCDRLCGWMTQHVERAEGGQPAEEAPEAPVGVAPPSTGSAEALRAYVVDGDGVEHASLIRIDKPWAVVFTWSSVAGLPADGEWQLNLLLRRVGPGQELHIGGPTHVPADAPRVDSEYRHRLEIPVGVVSAAQVETLYRASATLMFQPASEKRIVPVGLVDLGLLRFYHPAGVHAEQPVMAASREG